MPNTVIEFNSVWKKFKRGEKLNNLRDAIPHFFGRIGRENGTLKNQEFWAVQDVSFSVKPGEVIGIMGPNGAGKSTILKLLSRIMNPTRGSMAIRGRLSALIEVTAGFHPELTGRENVYLNGTILGMKKKEIDAKFGAIVDFSGVGEFIDTPVKRYSSGMYSRLGFSVAAHMDPDILLVDEVLSVGDIAFQAKCAQKMRELMSSGATIVLVSHNLSLVQSLCRRLVLLDHGKVLRDGHTDDVLPYYENLVFKTQEDEFKKEISTSDRVRIKTGGQVEISKVVVQNRSAQKHEAFLTADPIAVTVEYEAKTRIADPVFFLDIVRADGVLCCSLKSSDSGFSVDCLEGKGTIKIDLGRLNLGPGIYLVKVSVWDNDLIHPFAMRNSDILRVVTTGGSVTSNAVFVPQGVAWGRTPG